MLSARTINYAVPPEGHFWKWSADYEAIEWADGRTLAMWPEVHAVLDHLDSESGVPPLGSVLLLLAACRDEWVEQRPFNHIVIRPILDVPQGDAILPEVAEVLITGLDVIHGLPKEFRSSLSAKCHLVSALFEGGPHSLPRKESAQVMHDLSVTGIGLSKDRPPPQMPRKPRFLRDIRALKVGLARHNAASLESLLRTGLDNPDLREPELPQQPLEPGEPRLLLDRLIACGGESGAAAAVAKRAIAMMNFPGSFGTPLDLPVGGIADITNRGTVDRLLPGELAWDDLVLAARLVHNEALYFRREIPPMNVAVSHTVLLDRGLRLWGTGRVFSLGVALGLRHHPALGGPGETFECAAATTGGFEYVELATPAGVRSALETLVPLPAPDDFLRAWWNAAMIVDDAAVPDLSFITAAEHLDEPATRGLLGEIAGWIHGKAGRFRVLSLERTGELELQAWSPGGNRTLFRGQIDLDEILKPPQEAAPAAKPTPPPLRKKADPLNAMLPIYAEARLPFLFPLVPQASAFLETSSQGRDGGIGVSTNRRLMHWPALGWGGQELLAELPGRQHWMGRDDHGAPILIASGEGVGGHVRVFRWEDEVLKEIEVQASRHPFPRHAAVSGGAVLLAYSDSVEALSLASGRRVAELTVKALPVVPVLLFDGEAITVLDSGKKPTFGMEAWTLSDSSWPRLFTPDGFSLEGGILRVRASGKCLAFDPMKLIWSEAKPSPASFASFDETSLSPAPGVTLQRATWGGSRVIWLDSRGLLHLQNLVLVDSPPWSILLSTTAASCWNPSRMLCSFEPRLRLPSSDDLPDVTQNMVVRLLKEFLSGQKEASSP